MEYIRLGKMFQIERDLMRTQAVLLLEDRLTSELHRSATERFDFLKKEHPLLGVERWGGSLIDTTITVYTVYPDTL